MIQLLIAVVLCLGVGGIGGVMTAKSVRGWYLTLRKPSWNPPSWLFGPVWTTLYVMMGVSAWLVWREGAFVGWAATAFVVQLALNGLWSYLFFYRHRPDLAFIEIIAMWASILATILLFYPVSALASYLLWPYLAWVSFASYLNFTIWRLNPRRV